MSVDPDLTRLLKRLKLGQVLPTLPERLTLARAQHLDYAAFLTLLLADEVWPASRRRRSSPTRAAATTATTWTSTPRCSS